MKFKAKLTPTQTSLLYNLIHPISRLHPSSSTSTNSTGGSTILYLDNDKLVLSTRGGLTSTSTSSSSSSSSSHNRTNHHNNTPSSTYTQSALHNNDAEGIYCFAELITKNGIFNSLTIQSIEQDNAILMDINIGQLKTALRGVLNAQLKYIKDHYGSAGGGGGVGGSGGNVSNGNGTLGLSAGGVSGPELVIKLAKRNGGLPHLCLDVKENKLYSSDIIVQTSNSTTPQRNTSSSSSSNMIGVHHAIPVRIMKVQELQYHVPPRLGMPDVQLELPNDRPLKNVVDRLRSISPHGKNTKNKNGRNYKDLKQM